MASAARTLILASASPRRLELLTRVGIECEVVPADLDESVRPGEAAVPYASRLAQAKCEAIHRRDPNRYVLAADTVVEVGKQILGKAIDDAQANAMLSRLSGTTHRVSTAYTLLGPTCDVSRVVTTLVTLRALGPEEISAYVAGGEWRGKAGAYAIQGQAAAMVKAIEGSVTNVIGLPLAEVIEDLEHAGAARLSYPADRAE